MASRIASEIWSATLSGWPMVTDSLVNRCALRRNCGLTDAPPLAVVGATRAADAAAGETGKNLRVLQPFRPEPCPRKRATPGGKCRNVLEDHPAGKRAFP